MAEEKVTAEGSGRPCPYCHTELEKGEAAHRCDRCAALHHVDCWVEGGGCSVFGCSTSDGQPESAPSTPTPTEPEPEADSADSGVADATEVVVGHQAPEEDFSIQRREKVPAGEWRNRRSILLTIVSVAVLVAAIIGVILLLGGSDTDQGFSPKKQPTAGEIKKKQNQAKEQAKRKKNRRILQMLQSDYVSDPGGNWTGFLPGGSDWGEPESQGDLNADSYNPRYRTTVIDSKESFVLVDTTPAEDPTENPENYTVQGKRISNKRVPHGDFLFADLIAYKGGTDDCPEGHCAKVMLSDGQGGGVTILASAESLDQAKTIVKNFAASVERDY